MHLPCHWGLHACAVPSTGGQAPRYDPRYDVATIATESGLPALADAHHQDRARWSRRSFISPFLFRYQSFWLLRGIRTRLPSTEPGARAHITQGDTYPLRASRVGSSVVVVADKTRAYDSRTVVLCTGPALVGQHRYFSEAATQIFNSKGGRHRGARDVHHLLGVRRTSIGTAVRAGCLRLPFIAVLTRQVGKPMAGIDFDGLARALATGQSRRQALRGFLGTTLGLGLLGPTIGVAEAASPEKPSRADIARHSAQLLSRMPDPAMLQNNKKLPSAVLAAIQADHQLLRAGVNAQMWNDSQLQAFQTQVSASVQQHHSLTTTLQSGRSLQSPIALQSSTAAADPPTNLACYSQCTGNFLTSVSACSAGLGGLLCELLALVSLDLCVVGCILGGLGL